MALMETPEVNRGWVAPDFMLLGLDGKLHSLQEEKGKKGTVIAFICNHCPYVQSITQRLEKAAQELRNFGVSLLAICSNDAQAYPEDSYEQMKVFACENHFSFPYFHDESQEVAKAYGAVCTPDFFGFDAELRLMYRGRLDSSRKETLPADAPCDLVDAMRAIALGEAAPEIQHPSMGCSIKWRV